MSPTETPSDSDHKKKKKKKEEDPERKRKKKEKKKKKVEGCCSACGVFHVAIFVLFNLRIQVFPYTSTVPRDQERAALELESPSCGGAGN